MKSIIKYLYHFILKVNKAKKILFLFIISNLFAIISKQLFFKKLPSVNQLVKISGMGKVYIDINCSFGYQLGGFHRYGYIELQSRYKNAQIFIGSNVATNNNIFICAANKVIIGDYSLIGQYVTIMDFEAHGTNPQERRKIGEVGYVEIGRNVWIGNNVMILKNTKIGDNSIVAAGAVVSGNFPDNVIIGGVPAKIMKYL